MSKKPIVIYHGNCADGFGAAWCFWSKYKDQMEYYPGVYQDDPPDCTDRDIYLVDFSYKRAIVEKIVNKATQVVLIDHHESAINDLKDLQGLIQYVDIERSGAGLAWDYLNPNLSRPIIIDHIEDRDLWRFTLHGTREIQSVLLSYPYEFEIWNELINSGQTNVTSMYQEGLALERKHLKDVKELVTLLKRRVEIGGYSVWVASLPYTMVSDAAILMAENEPFAACYWDTSDSRIFGLRSREDGVNVANIAKHYGGGGHKNASGFRVPRDHRLAKI